MQVGEGIGVLVAGLLVEELGFYVRHARLITFHNVHLSLRDSDFRPAFVFDDVRQITMEQVTPDETVFN